VQGVVRGVEIENDLLGRRLVRLEEELAEQALDRRRIMADLVVARGLGRGVLEPVERALAGERRARLAPRRELAGEGLPAPDRGAADRDRSDLHTPARCRIPVVPPWPGRCARPGRRSGATTKVAPGSQPTGASVDEAGGEPPDQTDRPIGRPEQERPGLGGDLAAIEGGHHLAALDHFVEEVHRNWPQVPIYARARDVLHATRLIARGATQVVPETIEASLQLSELVLIGAGVPDDAARHLIEVRRQAEQAALDESSGRRSG
jgi:hypothetical protein